MMGRVPIAKKESSASSCERKTHGFEFDLELFLKNLLSHRNKDRPFICEADRVIAICDRVRSLMEADQCLATMSPPCTVVGDIHGQFTDLLRLLMSRSKEGAKQKKRGYGFSSERWVFLGDYVDRGPQSLHCIMTMFTLKVIYPRNFVLLRGNHETKAINCAYGFMQEVQMVFDESDRGPMWEKFNEVFAWMPLACLIGGKILCMHGGISEALRSLNDIVAIKRPVHDVNTCKLAQDLLWADPCEPHLVTAIDE
uniref:Serine/threonine-protein phosphatase n=1 Tax=Caenorhabditis japonica TaxID=281687 RepID=A0A8R1DGM6_CAEJA